MDTSKCPLCNHPDVEKLNSEYAVTGDNNRIVRNYSTEQNPFNQKTAFDHFTNHLAPAIAQTVRIQTRAQRYLTDSDILNNIVGRMAALIQNTEGVLDRAESKKDDRLVLSAVAELRTTLLSVSKLLETGQQAKDSQDEIEEAKAVLSALRTILPAYPEAGRALAVELENAGQLTLSMAISALLARTSRL